MTAYRVLKETQYGIFPIAANSQHSHAQAVILVSWNPEGFSPQIRVITGNKRRDASFLETKASTTFNAGSGIESSLETITIGICGLRRFISVRQRSLWFRPASRPQLSWLT
jgi:hypothetical protein